MTIPTRADPTPITPPRVPLIDQRTGLIDRSWYLFFLSLFRTSQVVPDLEKAVDIDISTAAYDAALRQLAQSLEVTPQSADLEPQIQSLAQAVQSKPDPADVTAAVAAAMQQLAVAPIPQEFSTSSTNYLDFELDAPKTNQIGRLGWNPTDQTLDIGMDYGVTQQVGLETYARVENATGVTIPNGTVVGFAGVGANNTLSVSPYNADGSVPTLYVLGIMTHDLPNSGEVGYCTTWGHVRGFDTSAFTVGDILYADPATPGGLTATKPTAPDAVIPMAAVLQVDATDGEIFVRPTIEQQKYYGVFSDSTTQTPAAIYTPYAITMNTTDIANGVARGTPTSRIVVSESGLYKFAFSLQIESGSSSTKKIWLWPRINGTDVPNSNSETTITGNQTVLVPAWSFTLSLTAGQYFELMYAVDDTGVSIVSKAAQAGAAGTATFARPAVPSIILEVTEVQQ